MLRLAVPHSVTNTYMKTKSSSAFTLIELLIVIAIIAILASIALPAFIGVQRRAKQTKDLSNGKQIVIALRQFALDNNGEFPNKAYSFGKSYTDSTLTVLGASNTSNEAFQWLIPTYTQSEEIFAVPGSKWNSPGPDNKIDSNAGGETLKAGENGYGYTAALQDTSNTLFPLVQDGWAAAGAPSYVADTSLPGGVWSATKAVVIFPDGAGQVMTVDDKTNLTVLRPGGYTYSIWDLSHSASPDDWLATSNFLLNPITPP